MCAQGLGGGRRQRCSRESALSIRRGCSYYWLNDGATDGLTKLFGLRESCSSSDRQNRLRHLEDGHRAGRLGGRGGARRRCVPLVTGDTVQGAHQLLPEGEIRILLAGLDQEPQRVAQSATTHVLLDGAATVCHLVEQLDQPRPVGVPLVEVVRNSLRLLPVRGKDKVLELALPDLVGQPLADLHEGLVAERPYSVSRSVCQCELQCSLGLRRVV